MDTKQQISAVPAAICFDGSESVTQVFSASITADISDLPYTVTSYNWDILSSNSGSAIKTDIDSLNVSYEFTASGEYTLEYLAIIDGTNSDCEYRDTIVFNVGVDAEIDFDNLICVGGEFSASSVVDDWSSGHSYLWSSVDELILGTDTESSTTISSVTPLGAGVSEIYDIKLTVTNDVGCWEEEIGEIEVYEVVADFIMSDTLLHCSPQDVTLTSLNNDNIESWNWTVDEQEHTQTISDTDPVYIHAFEDKGYSDLTLIIGSTHGCLDTLKRSEAVFLNGYEAQISAVPAAICFDGSESVTQVFSSSITADISDLPYTVTSYNWDILSSNSGSAIKTDIDSLNVSYEFTASGEYTLEYLAVIDGTNSDCEYRDTIVFNVGVDTEIDFDNLICVGGEFSASSVVDDWSSSHTYLWSSESELILGTDTESSTTISSVTPLGAGVSEIYDIKLTVTNDVGCWEEEIGEIEVYEVVADFIMSDTLLHCSPQDVTLTSLNNDNIESWNWTVDEQEHTQTISDTDPVYIHNFDSIGYYNINLIIFYSRMQF